jgi:ParB-like chromosome segregation protein Spo0J
MTPMPKFEIMPPLTVEEEADLEKSIAENGVLTPIVVDEHGNIIDGHHRQRIADRLGVFCPRRTVRGKTNAETIAMALTLNVDRRHLTRDQRRELLTKSIKADPALSDRQHGRRTGTDHKTASKVRDQLAGRGEIPHVDQRTDTAGRRQPASKPKTNGVESNSQSKLDAKGREPRLQFKLTAIRNDEWMRLVNELGRPADTDAVVVRVGKAELHVTLTAVDSDTLVGEPKDRSCKVGAA